MNAPRSDFGYRQMTSLLCAFVFAFYPFAAFGVGKNSLDVHTAFTQDKTLSKLQDPMCCQNINSNCLNLKVPNLLSTHYLE